MAESDFYPAGAYNDPNAPYNEHVTPEADFPCIIRQTLVRNAVVTTNDYNEEYDDETGNTYNNTENTDWDEAYKQSGNYTLLELLEELKTYVKQDMDKSAYNSGHYRHCKRILEQCQGWECEESEIEEN